MEVLCNISNKFRIVLKCIIHNSNHRKQELLSVNSADFVGLWGGMSKSVVPIKQSHYLSPFPLSCSLTGLVPLTTNSLKLAY